MVVPDVFMSKFQFFGVEFFQAVPESPGAEQKSSRLEYAVDTRNMDPAKAKQAERLGMGGMGSRR